MLNALERARRQELGVATKKDTKAATAPRLSRPHPSSSAASSRTTSSLGDRIRGWRTRRSGSPPASSMEADLEGQPERHSSSSRGSGIEPRHVAHMGEEPVTNEPEEQQASQSHRGGSSRSLAAGVQDIPRAVSGATQPVSSGDASSARDSRSPSTRGSQEGGERRQEEETRQDQEAAGTSARQPRRWKQLDPPHGNLNEYLLTGYLGPGRAGLQTRRTLDQYTYAYVETTSHSDDDQVVYRYTQNGGLGEAKIFMVDQWWVWVLGPGPRVPTCQRGGVETS